MVSKTLKEKLENDSGMKLKVTINDNRSTMLSVRWEPDHARVSLHRMFLEAPQNVMQALACYIKGEHKAVAPTVKAFIEKGLRNLDYTHELNQRKIVTQGTVYNLNTIYDDVNSEYFDNRLKLSITWFGKPGLRHRTRVTFGLYHDPLKLIKINRLLDSPLVPHYIISFVVYHEMLHNVSPSYFDERGLHQIHSKEFKEQETRFRFYNAAQCWIKEHQGRFFATLD